MRVFVGKVGETLYDGEAVSVTAPGSAGVLTILDGHMPLVTTLERGIVRVQTQKNAEALEFAATDGVLEVTGDGARVLL